MYITHKYKFKCALIYFDLRFCLITYVHAFEY